MPLVIVNVAPVFVHAPALENVTALPEPPPVAATVKPVPKTADAGACVVTLIVWLAFCASRLDDLRRRVVVRVAGLVVLHRAGAGAARHRERRAEFEQAPELENVTAPPEAPSPRP